MGDKSRKVNGVRIGNPNETKTGKPNLHSKTTEQLTQMLASARPKQMPKINNVLMRRTGRGR